MSDSANSVAGSGHFRLRAAEVCAGAAALAVPLAAVGRPETIEAVQATALALLGCVAGLFALASGRCGPAGLGLWCASGFLAWSFGAALASPFARPAATELLVTLGAAGVALAVACSASRRVGVLALVSATMVGALALLPPNLAGGGFQDSRPSGPLADAETLGVTVVPAAAAAVVLARIGYRAALLPALFGCAGVVASLSRGAGLALIAGVVAGELLLRQTPGRRPRRGLLVAVAGALIAVAVLLVSGRGALLSRRVNLLREVRAAETPSRPELARMGLELILERPLLGFGPGSFPHLSPDLTRGARDAGRLGPESSPWLHVQNDVIEVAAGVGLPGLACLLGLLATAMGTLLGSRVPERPALLAAGVAGVCSGLLHHPLESAASRLMMGIVLGMALSCPRSGIAHTGRGSVFVTPAMAALGLVLTLRAWPFDPGGGLSLARAERRTLRGDHRSALSFWHAYAAAAPPTAQAALRLGRALGRTGDWAGAESRARHVLLDWPRDEGAHLLVGEVLHATGRDAEALQHLVQVRRPPLARRARRIENLIHTGRAISGPASPDL